MTINSVQKSSKSESSSGGKRPFKVSSKSTKTSNKNNAIRKNTETVKHRNCVEARLVCLITVIGVISDRLITFYF